MRLLVQRVKKASVVIDGMVCGVIEKGVLAFLGIHKNDLPEDTEWMVKKLINLRIFSDHNGKMNLNVQEVQGEALIVSQFTLYGNCLSGRRPDFLESAPPSVAIPIYEKFLAEMTQKLGKIQSGQFGADMQVSLINDGPVTLMIESVPR